MSPPWMPLYVADYLADTTHLSAAEHGAYLLLIMHYWQKGALPTDDAILARVCRMTPREWAKSRETIAALFGPGWTHERINFELEKAARKSEARAESGARGGAAKSLKEKEARLANAIDLPEVCHDDGAAKPIASSSQPRTSSLRSEASTREADFDRFLTAYPKRTNRKAALTRFLVVTKTVPAEKLIAGAGRYAAECAADHREARFIKAPDVWLNKGCWDDEPQPAARAGPAPPRETGGSMLAKMAFPEFFGDPFDQRSDHDERRAPPASDPRHVGPDLDFSQPADIGSGWAYPERR